MSVLTIKQQVEQRVQEALVPALLARAVVLHQKWEWRTCPCTYCEHKRKVHQSLQFTPMWASSFYDRAEWREGKLLSCRRQLSSVAEEVFTEGE